MGKIILTGDRPTGKLHVGHYVGSLRRRVELQNSGEFDKIYIMIAGRSVTGQYNLHHDCRRTGADRQCGQSGEGAPEYSGGSTGLPFLRT